MNEITPEMLAGWRALTEAATEGPWVYLYPAQCCPEGCVEMGGGWHGFAFDSEDKTPDRQFIAAARTAVPALIAEVERLTAEQDQAYGQESDAEADRDHWQARALAAEERVDGQAWEELTARAERAEAEVAQLMADLIPVDQAWQQGYTDSERDCPACAEVQRLRERIEGLADEYDERSRDTESTERYPWGVAADDLRALLGPSDGSGL